MSQIIAGIYEIQEKIGAGGGGIVYLGRHIRLDKKVVLKADKRTLDTKPEVLRREVDLLKKLSHTYIPQVYDFVEENGVVYTVMDFIEGESLDKRIAAGRLPSQPELIRWACQLLEALSYLHSRPPYGILHGDIKPANIMLRPDGNICLIDFNIALALGEEGAVKVGFSRGYASPEHYGADFIRKNKAAAVGRVAETGPGARKEDDAETETLTLHETDVAETETLVLNQTDNASQTVTLVQKELPSATGKSTTLSGGAILLDVRSDIYSLGATLYHLTSGRRPAQKATEVEPLGTDVCSPAVSAILQKAMANSPAERYQTADEMLADFLRLPEHDRRTRKHRKRERVWAAVCSVFFLAGGASTFIGLKQMEHRQSALVMSEYAQNALAEGEVSQAVQYAMQAIPSGKSVLDAPVTAQAQKALADALGIYDLSDGFKAYDSIELTAVPFQIALSPQGTRMAAVNDYQVDIFDTESRERIVSLKAEKSAMAEVAFLNEDCILYAGAAGITVYDIKTEKTLWTGERATTLAVSGDGSKIAAVDRKKNYAVLYRAADGTKLKEFDFGNRNMNSPVNDIFANPQNDVFSLNEDGSKLAVSFSDGSLSILGDEELILYEASDYSEFDGGFCGDYFAYTANGRGNAVFGLIDTKMAEYVGGYDSKEKMLLHADAGGIYLADGNLLVRIDAKTQQEQEIAYTGEANITGFSVREDFTLVTTDDNSFSIYDSSANCLLKETAEEACDFTALAGEYALIANRNEPAVRILKQKEQKDSQLLSYDAHYLHDEARISHDGTTAMLFSFEGFQIYDMSGNLIAEENFEDAEAIYDQQFRKDEKDSWLEVIWYDGTVRCYSASDGKMVSETVEEAPDMDLYEEFFTDKYRFASSLHDAPKVYDRETDELVTTLEKESYLTYVTPIGSCILTEYVSAEGERYGLLLDSRLDTIARLPYLCDMTEEVLVFDYGTGNLRQCRLHSFQELVTLGKAYLSENERRNH